jgi:hypothetical protein
MTTERDAEDNKLVRAEPGVSLATSARTARPGQLLVLDGHGREVQRGGLLLRQMVLGLVLGSLGAPFVLLDLPLLGFGVVAVGIAGLILVNRARMPYWQAQARVTAGDLAGAEAILARLDTPARGVAARQRVWIEGWIAYARGQDREAIRLFERGLSLSGRGVYRVILEIELVNLYVRTGDVARARALRARISPPRPEGDLITITLASADMMLALAEGRERELAEDDLQRWTRLALEINHTSVTLAVLARVFAARGDDDLADHLAREARDRFCWCPLECMPALAKWVDARIARAPALTSGE